MEAPARADRAGGVFPGSSDAEIPVGNASTGQHRLHAGVRAIAGRELGTVPERAAMEADVDYTLSGNTVTFFTGVDSADRGPAAGELPLRQSGESVGNADIAAGDVQQRGHKHGSATTLTQLGSCTIPAGLLGTGDRIEAHYQYSHVGSTAGFTGEVHIGGTTVVSRSAAATETEFVGRTDLGTYSGAQLWDTQSWGTALVFAAAVGSATIDITQALTVDFRGEMAAAGSDSVVMRNFTVVRYPAQSNP